MTKTSLLVLLLALAVSACSGNTVSPVSPPVSSPTVATPLPHSLKGYELYSWPVNADWQFTLITGTNRTKSLAGILDGENAVTEDGWVRISVHGVEAIKAVLSELPPHEEIFWLAKPHSQQGREDPIALPPQGTIAVLQQYCEQLGLRLHVDN